MRRALALPLALSAALAPGACASPKNPPTTQIRVDPDGREPEVDASELGRLLRTLHRNVRHYHELLRQLEMDQAAAMRGVLASTVDAEFETLVETARAHARTDFRNRAVSGLAFARDRRHDARAVLMELLDDPNATIVANAAYGIGILRLPDTDLTRLIELLASGDARVRESAARGLKELFRVVPTPRELTQQYRVAVDRLAALLHDPASPQARQAAAWAIANLHHPDMLDLLVGMLSSGDLPTQLAGLHGLALLGDQRAIEPLLAYLDDEPPQSGASGAVHALSEIAVQSGLATTAGELHAIGPSAAAWRKWFAAARMR